MSEALRIQLAHQFDPALAVHTSQVDPLPYQITAVYEAMLTKRYHLGQLLGGLTCHFLLLTATPHNSMNKAEDYRFAIVEFLDDGAHRFHYLREPFRRELDFDAASVNYFFKDLLARAEPPC